MIQVFRCAKCNCLIGAKETTTGETEWEPGVDTAQLLCSEHARPDPVMFGDESDWLEGEWDD